MMSANIAAKAVLSIRQPWVSGMITRTMSLPDLRRVAEGAGSLVVRAVVALARADLATSSSLRSDAISDS